jgi:hypothetical protein
MVFPDPDSGSTTLGFSPRTLNDLKSHKNCLKWSELEVKCYVSVLILLVRIRFSDLFGWQYHGPDSLQCCGFVMIFSNPDPTFKRVPDPDPVSDPA